MAAAGDARAAATAFADPGELEAPRGLSPARAADRARSRPARASWRRGTSSVSSDATSTGRAAELGEQLEHRVALLVAHQHDDPRRIRPAAVRPIGAGAVELGPERLGLGS